MARSRAQKRRTQSMWTKPKFIELRLGFEVTLYSGYR
jgi:coenzyme PQQ precursor peptide PqqA